MCVGVWNLCCISIYCTCVPQCIDACAHVWVCADILCNNISDESGINCWRLAPLMLLFLPLWQLCWTVQRSTGDTKKILWQSQRLLSRCCNLTASGLVNVMNLFSLFHYQLSASYICDTTILCKIHTNSSKCKLNTYSTVKVMYNSVSKQYY